MKSPIILLSIVALMFNCLTSFAQGRRGGPPPVPFENVDEASRNLKALTDANEFSGAVLVVKNGETVLQGAYGYLSKEDGLMNQMNTKFNIGSCNKIFTQVAIMKLIQEGKISLSDKVIQYIPELKMEMADEITIYHLLDMSSGFGFYSNSPAFRQNWRLLKNMEDYLPIIADLELSFKPGSTKAYSNAGYELLGILVQRVSKTNYYDFVKEHIYSVAGMRNTDAYESDKPTANLAQGYTNYAEGEMMGPGSKPSGAGYQRNNINQHSIKGTAAGGGYSTAQDMRLFLDALWNNRLLDSKHTDYIYNRFVDKAERRSSISFAGGSLGINAAIMFDNEKKYIVIVMTNYDPPTASNMALRLQKSILEDKF